MRKHIKRVVAHPLISGSTIVFMGSLAANLGNYIFNLAMGRMLSVAEYGMLLSVISVIGLLTVFQGALTNILAKFSAKFTASEDEEHLNELKKTGIKIIGGSSIAIFIIMTILSGVVTQYLHLSSVWFWFIASLSVAAGMLTAYTTGLLQGGLNFIFLAVLAILGVAAKLITGIGLVFFGFGVGGGLFAFITYFLAPLIIAFPFVRPKNRRTKKISEKIFIKEIREYSIPFLLATLGITFLQGGDVIMVRHFFPPVESGQFAALSLMGKAIFYFTTPIYFVFFPLIAQKREKKEKLSGTLILASAIVLGCSSIFSLIYFIFPELIVGLFFPGISYKITIPYLGPFSLYVMVFSFAYLLNSFFLSSGRTNVWKIDVFVCFVFIVLFYIFHQNFTQALTVLFVSSFLLLSLLLVYYKANGSK